MNYSTGFLEKLLDAPGPSGFEQRAAATWRQEAETFADVVRTDVAGNTFATVNPEGSPCVMMAGHIDEIGLQVTHVDDEGFLYFSGIGGWDPQVVVGQRVRILIGKNDLIGVVGKKAIHLQKPEQRKKVSQLTDLWVDIGASSRQEVEDSGLRVGDPMVIDAPMVSLKGDRISSRAVDDRVGAYVILEALRTIADASTESCAVAVATVQEEIGGGSGGGARVSSFALQPDVALVVDVTFSTDVPDISKKELGDHKLGGGPVLSRGSAIHPVVFDRLTLAAEAEGIPYTIQAAPRATRTDADSIYMNRAGVPTGLVSIPNRYMHSPNEMVSLADLTNTAKLLAAFVLGLGKDTDFTPL
ncbi:MAG TPA: M42 family peptidase [Gemmatimonadetes bacterium]|jgi:endoglucanase|nr:M42 family peptidase [Gemmatimonadota bacterium]